MAKKRTKKQKKKVQAVRSQEQPVVKSDRTRAPSQTVQQNIATAVPTRTSEAPIDPVLTPDQQKTLKGDIMRSLAISAVIGLVLFGIFFYILNAVQ